MGWEKHSVRLLKQQYRRALLILWMYVLLIPISDSTDSIKQTIEEGKVLKEKPMKNLLSLKGILQSDESISYTMHKPSSLEEMIEIFDDASSKIVLIGGGAIFNFGNDPLYFDHEYTEKLMNYVPNQTSHEDRTMTISNTNMPYDDFILVSTAYLTNISMHLNDVEPYIWADAGVTFGRLSKALHEEGYQFLDGPGFADITLGAATAVKAHGNTRKEFIDSVKEVQVYDHNTKSVIDLNQTEEILALNTTDSYSILRMKVEVEKIKTYLTTTEYFSDPNALYLDSCLATDECSSFQHFGSNNVRIDKTQTLGENSNHRAKNMRHMYSEWFKIRMCSWIFDTPTPPCHDCSHTRKTGFLWPEYSYEASFPILNTIEIFYTTINSEIYIHKNHVDTTTLSNFILNTDATGRVEIRKQGDFLWIDIVLIELKQNFGLLKLQENSVMESFYGIFEGKPFYQHEGKRVFPSISSYSFLAVRHINGSLTY